MIRFEASGLTDIGNRRKQNEDTYVVNEDLGLFIVADGMGGHRAGEVASALAVKNVVSLIENFDGHVSFSVEGLSPPSGMLYSAVLNANKVIHETASTVNAYRGMGTTIAAVYLSGRNFIAVNLGDSPIFWIHDGAINQVSVDHTATVMVSPNNKEPGRPAVKKPRRVLTQSLGVRPEIQPDICELPCYKNDILVLASDGLTDKVGVEEIRDISVAMPPHSACRTLVRLANERGGDDNITVVIVQIKKIRRLTGLVSKLFRWIGIGGFG